MAEHTKDNPWTIAPPDWHENGVPYGDYCKCASCGLVARSTYTFDYYADEPGEALLCESCRMGVHRDVAKIADDIATRLIEDEAAEQGNAEGR